MNSHPTTFSADGSRHRRDQKPATPESVSKAEAQAIDEWNRKVLESWEEADRSSPPTQTALPSESRRLREFPATAVFREALRRLLSPLLRLIPQLPASPTAPCASLPQDRTNPSSQALPHKEGRRGKHHSSLPDNSTPPPVSPLSASAATACRPGAHTASSTSSAFQDSTRH